MVFCHRVLSIAWRWFLITFAETKVAIRVYCSRTTRKVILVYMKIALLGFGLQNRSAYTYWNQPENEITICAQKDAGDLPGGVAQVIGDNYLDNLERFDMLVRSPSIHPRQIVQANPEIPNILDKVTTNTNEFFRVCPAPVIGVTGTKGKGTTSTLISKILETAGHKVHLGGNIGTPPLELLKNDIKPTDTVVLELANFQLIDLKYSPKIAVCLIVNEEHLDWHADMFEYIHAKQQLFAHQTHDNLAVYNERSEYSEQVASISPARKISYDVPPIEQETLEDKDVFVHGNKIIAFGEHVCDADDVALLGRHNLENVCAAIAATFDIVQGNTHILKKAIKNFKGLAHRIEILGQKHGIWFVNDSFASNPGATIAAMAAVKKHKVMIIGGYERDLNLEELITAIKANQKDIRKVVLIGASGPRVASELTAAGFTNFELTNAQTMPEVVASAQKHAQKGDAIVLSPAFASFDMFKNFEDRGLQFKAVFEKL